MRHGMLTTCTEFFNDFSLRGRVEAAPLTGPAPGPALGRRHAGPATDAIPNFVWAPARPGP